jgi:hypothetical protein
MPDDLETEHNAIFCLRDASRTVRNGSKMYVLVKYEVLAALPIYNRDCCLL